MTSLPLSVFITGCDMAGGLDSLDAMGDGRPEIGGVVLMAVMAS